MWGVQPNGKPDVTRIKLALGVVPHTGGKRARVIRSDIAAAIAAAAHLDPTDVEGL